MIPESVMHSLEAFPVEGGKTHPAESELGEYIKTNAFHYDRVVQEVFEVPFAEDLIHLAGRVSGLPFPFQALLVRRGLKSSSVAIRDAAIGAAENWGERRLAKLLIGYNDTEEWLIRYARGVAKDLQERRDENAS